MLNQVLKWFFRSTPVVLNSADGENSRSLSQYKPFSDLPKASQIVALSFGERIKLTYGKKLFTVQMDDEHDYFLVDGEVSLVSSDGRQSKINASSTEAFSALGLLRPRQMTATVSSFSARFYQVPHHIVKMAYDQLQGTRLIEPDIEVVIGDVPAESLQDRVAKAIEQGKLTLASLPEVALRVRQACNDPDCSLEQVADIVSHDTSMSVKLIEAANSPLYKGASLIKTIKDAVCRLGKETTLNLVFYFSTKELFKSSIPILNKSFRLCWKDSLRRALMAKTIAQLSPCRLDPDTAFLCGLLFRIGDLAVLQYLVAHTDDIRELVKVQQLSERDSAANGRLVATNWHLPDTVQQVLAHAGHWEYQSESEQANYIDLIITTNFFLRVMSKRMAGVPPIKQIPALQSIMSSGFAGNTSVMSTFRQAIEEFKL